MTITMDVSSALEESPKKTGRNSETESEPDVDDIVTIDIRPVIDNDELPVDVKAVPISPTRKPARSVGRPPNSSIRAAKSAVTKMTPYR